MDPFSRALERRRQQVEAAASESAAPPSPKARGLESSELARLAFGSSSSSHQQEEPEEWVLYYSPEGYPYYYNNRTGESQWAEQQEQAAEKEEGLKHKAKSKTLREAAETTDSSSDEEEEEESDEDEEEDESGSGSDSEDSEDSEDEDDSGSDSGSGTESGSDGDSGDSDEDEERGRGGVLLNRAMEAKFKAFLQTSEGKAIMEEEQARIARRLEQRAAKRRLEEERERARQQKRQDRKSKGKKKHAAAPEGVVGAWLSTLQSSVYTLASAASTTASVWVSKAAATGRIGGGDSDDKLNKRPKQARPLPTSVSAETDDGAAVRKTVTKWSDIGPVQSTRGQRSIDFTTRAALDSESDDEDEDKDGGDDDDDDSISSSDSDVQEISAPLIPPWLSWGALVQRWAGSGLTVAASSKGKNKGKSKDKAKGIAAVGVGAGVGPGLQALRAIPLVAQGMEVASWATEWAAYGLIVASAALWTQFSRLIEQHPTAANAVRSALPPRPPAAPPKSRRFVLRPEPRPQSV